MSRKTKKELLAEVVELRRLLERQVVRANIYLECLAQTRELAANFSPALAHSQGYEPIRKMMSDDGLLDAEIDKRISEAREDGLSYV